MHTGNYLFLRGTTYYFLRRIPKDVKPHYGTGRASLATFSLNTKIASVAAERAREHACRLDKEFKAIRRGLALQVEEGNGRIVPYVSKNLPVYATITDDLKSDLCNSWLGHVLTTDVHNRSNGFADLDPSTLRNDLAETNERLRQIQAEGRFDCIDGALESWLWINKLEVSREDPSYEDLRAEFFQTVYKAHQLVMKRHNGEFVDVKKEMPPDFKAGFVSPPPPRKDIANTGGASFPAVGSPMHMESLQAQWEKQKARPKATSVDMTAILAELKKFLPNSAYQDTSLISKADVLQFADKLFDRGQSYKTVLKKTKLICALFQVAVDREQLLRNPASKLKLPKRNMTEQREPFNRNDLEKIFSSGIFKGDIPKAGKGAAAKWLPLLALYTGARLEELAQLLTADIHEEQGLGHYIYITEAGSASEHQKQLKTSTSKRRIPIHPDLVKLGFIQYYQSCAAKKETMLFPELLTDAQGKRSGNWSKWWGNYMRGVIGIKEPTKVFHSFRHTFIDACRESGLDEEIHDALTGHQSASVSRNYGSSLYPLKPLFAAMPRIRYSIDLGTMMQ